MVVVVIAISITWMILIGYLWKFIGYHDHVQLCLYWLLGTAVFGYLYLRHAKNSDE